MYVTQDLRCVEACHSKATAKKSNQTGRKSKSKGQGESQKTRELSKTTQSCQLNARFMKVNSALVSQQSFSYSYKSRGTVNSKFKPERNCNTGQPSTPNPLL